VEDYGERNQANYRQLVNNHDAKVEIYHATKKHGDKTKDDRAVASYNLLKKYAEDDGALAKLLDLI
jgi:general stress protein 26